MSSQVFCNYHANPDGLFLSRSTFPRAYSGAFDFEERSIEIVAPMIVVFPETEMYAKEFTLTCKTLIHLGVLEAERITLNAKKGYLLGEIGTLDGKPKMNIPHSQMFHTAQEVVQVYQTFLEQNNSRPFLITGIECSRERSCNHLS